MRNEKKIEAPRPRFEATISPLVDQYLILLGLHFRRLFNEKFEFIYFNEGCHLQKIVWGKRKKGKKRVGLGQGNKRINGGGRRKEGIKKKVGEKKERRGNFEGKKEGEKKQTV